MGLADSVTTIEMQQQPHSMKNPPVFRCPLKLENAWGFSECQVEKGSQGLILIESLGLLDQRVHDLLPRKSKQTKVWVTITH